MDPGLKAPPQRKQAANAHANKHQRRPSFHTRRRSQHSIASFGDIADDVIKAPAMGSLGEETKVVIEEDYSGPNVEKKKKKHDRKSSNIHELFGGEGEEDEGPSMDNIVQSLMLEEEEMSGHSGQYSPTAAIELEDAPLISPPPKPQPPKNRHQSFSGIIDLFDKDELEGKDKIKQTLEDLRDENHRLQKALEKSNNEKMDLQYELDQQRSGSHLDEIERVKSSKIKLITAFSEELDRLRNIILLQNMSLS